MPAAKKVPAKKAASDREAGKQAAFTALKALLARYEKDFTVVDGATGYLLNTREPLYNKKPLMFAGVSRGKTYTAFYLFQLYMFPEKWKLSDGLRERRQGKSCLNFTAVDDELFGEIEVLLREGAKLFRGLSAEKVTAVVKAAQGRGASGD